MTRTIDRAVKHFDTLVAKKLQHMRVEEWETDIYYRGTMTWAEQSRILDLSSQQKTSEALIETILIRCLDEAGEPLFTKADRTMLQHSVDPEVLLNIVSRMNANQPDYEELEKN